MLGNIVSASGRCHERFPSQHNLLESSFLIFGLLRNGTSPEQKDRFSANRPAGFVGCNSVYQLPLSARPINNRDFSLTATSRGE